MHSHEAQSRDIEYVPEHRMCVELERLVDFLPSFFSVCSLACLTRLYIRLAAEPYGQIYCAKTGMCALSFLKET